MPKVLVVDDDQKIVEMVTEFLEFEGWEFASAPNGKEALDLLDASFDAVILDLHMPMMDGETTLAEIRKRIELESVSVVILTAFGEVDSAVRTIRQGAYQYLQKPFGLPDLLRILVSGIASQKANALRRGLLASLDIDKLLDQICAIITETINPKGLYLIFLSSDGSIQKMRGGFPAGIRQYQGKPPYFLQHILKTNQPFFEDDETRIGRWDPILKDARSLLAVPVPGNGNNIAGIIDIESHQENAFDRSWVELLSYLSDLAGISIEITEKAKRNAQLLAESEHWRKMPRLVQELGHHILTPVQIITMQVQTLMDKELKSGAMADMPDDLVAEMTRRIKVVGKSAEAIANVCDHLRDISRDIPIKRKRFNLVEVLDSCIEDYLSELDVKQIAVGFSKSPAAAIMMDADPGLLGYVVKCVISNAIEAIQQRRERKTGENVGPLKMARDQITITLDADEASERVFLAIRDTGIGILPEELEKIFEPLFTTKERECLSGMGLFSARRIINGHGGAIKAASDYGHGATFTISLPWGREARDETPLLTGEGEKEKEG